MLFHWLTLILNLNFKYYVRQLWREFTIPLLICWSDPKTSVKFGGGEFPKHIALNGRWKNDFISISFISFIFQGLKSLICSLIRRSVLTVVNIVLLNFFPNLYFSNFWISRKSWISCEPLERIQSPAQYEYVPGARCGGIGSTATLSYLRTWRSYACRFLRNCVRCDFAQPAGRYSA